MMMEERMAAPELDVSVLQDSDTGALIGVSFEARPQSEAEDFCATLPRLLAEGQAGIRVENGMMRVTHPTWGVVSSRLPLGTESALKALLEGKDLTVTRARLSFTGEIMLHGKGANAEGAKKIPVPD